MSSGTTKIGSSAQASTSTSAPVSTSSSKRVSPSARDRLPIKTPEAPESLDDLLRSPHNPALQQPQRTTSSSDIKGAPPHDARRRNGFHLWRTESEDAKSARLRRAVEEAEATNDSQWHLQSKIPGLWQRFQNRVRTSPLALSIYRDTEERQSEIDSDRPALSHEHVHIPTLSEPKLTRFGLIVLTISLAGAQLAWTLELAYGTPYLLSLGLSEQSTSLVWLAGPLSGLIAQPVVGSLSDASTSSFRRRKYMIMSAALLTLSTLTLAYSVPISLLLVDFFGGGLADWDPKRNELVAWTVQLISVVAFWILDFALNGLQASSRALILDTAPSDQQSVANAWHGRMTHAGNVVGYLCGWVDLASWRGLTWLGGGQFRRFAMVSLLGMITCVSVTVACISETSHEGPHFDQNTQNDRCCSQFISLWNQTKETVYNVWHAIRRLPRSVRRVCLVQLFAFMGWFPFLFYGTTYVLQVAEYQRKSQRHPSSFALSASSSAYYFEGSSGGEDRPSSDKDAERGSFAMLMFALVALASGALLPYLSLAGEKRHSRRRGSFLGLNNGDADEEEGMLTPRTGLFAEADEDPETTRSRGHGPEAEPKLPFHQRIWRGLRYGLTLRTFWTLASLLFACLMLFGTAWASTVEQATIVIALVGLPWSVAAWAPFAMVGEFVREAEEGSSPFEFEGDHWSPERTRARQARRVRSIQRKSRRDSQSVSIRQSVSSPTRSINPSHRVGTGNGMRYIRPESSPHARRLSQGQGAFQQHGSPNRSFGEGGGGGEEGARERIRASLVNCAPLPSHLESPSRKASGHSGHDDVYDDTPSEEDQDDYDFEYDPEHPHTAGSTVGTGRHATRTTAAAASDESPATGGGTILGIHNLAIVAPQFIVAIISSLIFRAIQNTNQIHLVLDSHLVSEMLQQNSSNPAEGTIWVLRFGGFMALFAALATRFVPLTLSERKQRFEGFDEENNDDFIDDQVHPDDFEGHTP